MNVVTIDESRAGEDPTHDPYTDRSHYFSGEVNVQGLVGPDESNEVELLAVFFGPGSRTRPHVHERDQVLHFITGRGIVATETEKFYAAPGDIVTMPAGVWHWHGATADSPACHISVRQPGATNWEVEEKDWASGYEDEG